MRANGVPLPELPAPAPDELAPVLLARFGKRFAHQLQLLAVPLFVALAADQLKALEHEVRVRGVCRAVVADALDLAGLVGFPHLRAVQAELAGETQQARHFVERSLAPVLVERQDVHQVHVPHMITGDVGVVSEVLVLVTLFPVARRGHAVNEAAVVQHRKVEAGAVPRYELRGVLLYAVEKAPDEHGLALFGAAQGPAAERILVAQRARDRHDAVLMQREEVVARSCAPLAKREFGDVVVGDLRLDAVQQAQMPSSRAMRRAISSASAWLTYSSRSTRALS